MGKTKKSKSKAQASTAEEEMPSQAVITNLDTWDTAYANLQEVTRAARAADKAEVLRATEISKYRIGWALLRFAGPNDVHGMVNLDQNPNSRLNPRGLVTPHVSRVRESIETDKQDRRTPIQITISPVRILPGLRTEMQAADPSNPSSVIPQFESIRPHAAEELALETALWLGVENGRVLSGQTIAEKTARLEALRKSRPMATLMNGNHRSSAMIEIGDRLRQEQAEIVAKERNGGDREEIARSLEALTEQVAWATYVVEVFRDDYPPHVGAWLTENKPERPTYPAVGGEKLWTLSEQLEAMVLMMVNSREAANREEALNQLNEAREIDASKKIITVRQATQLLALDLKQEAGPKNPRIAGQLDVQACRNLFSHPLTMEMVLDTKSRLACYDKRLLKTHAALMRREAGASLAAHWWLAVRTILRITNVDKATGLEDIESYIKESSARFPTLREQDQAFGETEAFKHWENLHKSPETYPVLLDMYDDEAAAEFDAIFREETISLKFEIGKDDWMDQKVILKMRRVFSRMGAWFGKRPGEGARKLSLSFAVYSRLPTYKYPCQDPCYFYPAALLPSKTWMSSLAKHVKGSQDSPGLYILELLLDRWQLPWTIGTIGSSASRNVKNWYRRAVRGSQQVLMRSLELEQLGDTDARLMFAINLLNGRNIQAAYEAIADTMGKELGNVRSNCLANKTGGAKYPVLEALFTRHKGRYGSVSEMQKKLDIARVALKEEIWPKDGDATDPELAPVALQQIARQHSMLHLVSTNWWQKFDLRSWALGWNDSEDKRRHTITAALGWMFFSDELEQWLLQKTVAEVPEAHTLINIARDISVVRHEDPWWLHLAFPPPQASAIPHAGKADKGKARAEHPAGERKSARLGNQASRAAGSQAGPSSRKPHEKRLKVEVVIGQRPSSDKSAVKSRAQYTSSDDESQGNPDADSDDDEPPPAAPASPPSEHANASGVDELEHTEIHAVASDVDEDDPGEGNDERHEDAPENIGLGNDGLRDDLEHDVGVGEEPEIKMNSPEHWGQVFGLQVEPNIRRTTSYLRKGVYTSVGTLSTKYLAHIMCNRELNDYIPEIIYAADLHATADPDEMDRRIARAPAAMKECLKGITAERVILRRSILEFARLLVKLPNGSNLAMSGAARTVWNFKDIFVWRSSDIIQKYFPSENGSLAQAAAMARADGLYEGEVLTMRMSDGAVLVHLLPTFAKGIQAQVNVKENILVGYLSSTEPERQRTWQMMRQFMPVHGYGRTRRECEATGSLGAMLHGNTRLMYTDDKNPAHYTPFKQLTPQLYQRSIYTGEEMANWAMNPGHENPDCEFIPRKRAGRPLAFVPEGAFSHPGVGQSCSNTLSKDQVSTRDELLRKLTEIWDDEQQADWYSAFELVREFENHNANVADQSGVQQGDCAKEVPPAEQASPRAPSSPPRSNSPMRVDTVSGSETIPDSQGTADAFAGPLSAPERFPHLQHVVGDESRPSARLG